MTSEITAVLGPTNTGKTHYAIERMLAHRTGVIGLPLRLLAREVYDRIVAVRGPGVVALVTGEERIVPERAAYWVCTVEAMPVGIGPDFLAVDEIQLCADPERGHVFTDRLLHARGQHETLFLGAETMRGAIAGLIPKARFTSRQRFSELTYTGAAKVARMKPRSAIVGFSVENVYALAELLKRQKGGAAVVMGALSPRTRNAQVELYQNGDVDYLVATDAIGMGLNLDVAHVAFSSTVKFDGRRMRPLMANELAQIAGRAGRFTAAGTFGVTGEAPPLHEEMVAAIQDNRFAPVRRLMWRNSDLRYGHVGALIASLEERTDDPWLSRARDADDLAALKTLAADPDVAARASGPEGVKRLWEVCRIPDFRGIGPGEHAAILTQIHAFLCDVGRVPDDWMARQIKRIDRVEGDIDTLSKRLAYIRTWTYVAQRAGWLDDGAHWRGATRAVEDRLSDALHGALTQRFVDRRTSVLLRRLKQKEAMVAEVNDAGEVTVEGQLLGRLEGFRFRQESVADAGEAKAMRQAAAQVLAPQFNLRADRFYNAPDTEMDFTEQGGLMWGGTAVGRMAAGADGLRPGVVAFVDEEAGEDARTRVERRLQHFVDRKVAALMEPLRAMQADEGLTGLARGLAFRLVEGFGILPRSEVAGDVKSLGQEDRALLRKHGVRFGQFTVFLPALLKPAPTRLRLVLWGLSKGLDEFPEAPPPGLVTIPAEPGGTAERHVMAGYRAAGERAIRIDMLERLADMIRGQDTRAGFEATPDMLSITGLTLEQFAELLRGLGYKAERGERPKVKTERAVAEAPGAAGRKGRGDTAGVPGAPPPEMPPPDVPMPMPGGPEPDMPPAPPVPGPDTPEPDVPLPGAPVPDAPGPDLPPESPPAEPGIPPSPDRPGEAPDEGPGPAPLMADDPDPAASVPPAHAATLDAGVVEAAEWEGQDDGGGDGDPAAEAAEEAAEVFYTFTWVGNRPARPGRGRGGKPRAAADGGGRPRGAGAKGGARGGGKGKGPRGPGSDAPRSDAPKTYAARPERKDRIDPDNPFAAALMGLKDK